MTAVHGDTAFGDLARQLAPRIHQRWRPSARDSPNDMDFDRLPEETKQANIAAAERIPRVLAVVGLRVAPTGTVTALDAAVIQGLINAHLEELSEAEHEGWMDEKRRGGWSYGLTRDEAARRHPSIAPYAELSEEEKDKDRESVLEYPELLRACGFDIALAAT